MKGSREHTRVPGYPGRYLPGKVRFVLRRSVHVYPVPGIHYLNPGPAKTILSTVRTHLTLVCTNTNFSYNEFLRLLQCHVGVCIESLCCNSRNEFLRLVLVAPIGSTPYALVQLLLDLRTQYSPLRLDGSRLKPLQNSKLSISGRNFKTASGIPKQDATHFCCSYRTIVFFKNSHLGEPAHICTHICLPQPRTGHA